MRGDFLNVVRYFRQQNNIGAAGNPGGQGDMSRIAAHHFQHHDAVMAGCRRLESVKSLGRHGNAVSKPIEVSVKPGRYQSSWECR